MQQNVVEITCLSMSPSLSHGERHISGPVHVALLFQQGLFHFQSPLCANIRLPPYEKQTQTSRINNKETLAFVPHFV